MDYTSGQLTRNLFITIMLVTIFVGYDVAHTPKIEVKAQEVPVSTSIPTATPEPLTPETYIKQKWGDESWKAFKVLQGKECAENRGLNPTAVNDNREWGGVGRDRGIFQINDVYHPLTDAQAFDWKQNIDYAYRMYLNDEHTFKRWTCGKFYGI